MSAAGVEATCEAVSETAPDPWKTRTLRPSGGSLTAAAQPRIYLLVLQDGSSSIFNLPTTGVVLVGRSPDADLPLTAETASRNHAKIMTSNGEVRLHDLGSHNGTFVNGERVDGTRLLLSSDVVTIGELTLILHAQPAQPETRPVLDATAMRQRLVEEVDRALRYQRPLTLLSLAVPSSAPREALTAAVAAELRLIDLIGWMGTQLVVALPELDREPIALGERLAALAGGARVGVAVCPDDGCDADTLAATAQAAAAAARPGQVAAAVAAAREITLGDRTIIVADPAMARLFDLIHRLATSELAHPHPAARPAPARRARRWRCTSARRGRAARSSRSTAPPSPSRWSRASCSATSAAPSPGPSRAGRALSRRRTAAPCSSTRSASSRWRCRPSCCARSSRSGLPASATSASARSTCASSPPPTASLEARTSRPAASARISTSAWARPPSCCRRLRDRPREIPMLARRFLAEACARNGAEPPVLSPAVMLKLSAYAWPGNVRELRNTMEYVGATVTDKVIEAWHLPDPIAGVETDESEIESGAADGSVVSFRPLNDEVRELEYLRIRQALEATGGVQVRAAALIGMPLRTFAMKVKQHGITPRGRRDT